jgi:hypothetical protein
MSLRPLRSAPHVWSIALLTAAGCNLTVHPFAGTVIEMTLDNVPVSTPGTHLELWARNGTNDLDRVGGIFDVVDPQTQQTTRLFPIGYVVRPAITMDDPCMINDAGELLVTAAAYEDATIAGVFQTANEQAASARAHIAELTSESDCDGSDPASWPPGTNGLHPAGGYHCGSQPGATGDILGLIAYELVDEHGGVTATPPPLVTCETHGNAAGCISFHADAQTRLAACRAYWANPLAYTPGALQLTAPSHGVLWGVISYVSVPSPSSFTPPGTFSAIRIDSPVGLSGIQELWITTEPKDAVDPLHRGPVLVTGKPTDGGIDAVHIDLQSPPGAKVQAAGSAALLFNLDL